MSVQTLNGGYAGHSSHAHGNSLNQHSGHRHPESKPAVADNQVQNSARFNLPAANALKATTEATPVSKLDDKGKAPTMPEVKGFLDKLFKQIEEMLKKFNPEPMPKTNADVSQVKVAEQAAASKFGSVAAAKAEPKKIEVAAASKVEAQATTKADDNKTDAETGSLSTMLKKGMEFGTSLLSVALGAFNALMPMVMKLIKS